MHKQEGVRRTLGLAFAFALSLLAMIAFGGYSMP
jgi:hypothetical protein